MTEPTLAFRAHGACRTAPDPDLFYGPEGYGVPGRVPGGTLREAAAKRICHSCPVLRPCRAWALRHEKWGVWGGLTENERQQIRERGGLPANPIAARPPAVHVPGRLTDPQAAALATKLREHRQPVPERVILQAGRYRQDRSMVANGNRKPRQR